MSRHAESPKHRPGAVVTAQGWVTAGTVLCLPSSVTADSAQWELSRGAGAAVENSGSSLKENRYALTVYSHPARIVY